MRCGLYVPSQVHTKLLRANCSSYKQQAVRLSSPPPSLSSMTACAKHPMASTVSMAISDPRMQSPASFLSRRRLVTFPQ